MHHNMRAIPKDCHFKHPVCGMHKEHPPASFALDAGFLCEKTYFNKKEQ